MTLRTPKTKQRYQEFLQTTTKDYCYFCHYNYKDDLIYEGKYWNLLVNHFPYDKIYSEESILSLKRHISQENDLTIKELEEFRWIKDVLLGCNHSDVTLTDMMGLKYDGMLENAKHRQSVRDHLHYHFFK